MNKGIKIRTNLMIKNLIIIFQRVKYIRHCYKKCSMNFKVIVKDKNRVDDDVY